MKTTLVLILCCSFLGLSLASAYDETLALHLTEISSLTYCQQPSAVYQDYKNISYMEAPGWASELYVLLRSDKYKRYVLAFRGTNTATELLTETLKSFAVAFKPDEANPIASGVKVEEFFYQGYMRLRNDVLTNLKKDKADHSDYKLYVTGHSLGGALANLAALDIVLSNIYTKDQMEVYTFGAPRTGDYAFAQLFQKSGPQMWRVVHHRDPVPHVPPCQPNLMLACTAGNFFIYGYHAGTEVFYDSENMIGAKYQYCVDEDMSCSNKYSLILTNVLEHVNYFGRNLFGCF